MALTKRFSDILEFEKGRSYSLLPIRFTTLDEERVVVTNMASEFVVIKKDELAQLVDDPNSLDKKIKEKLLSKHIIYEVGDEVALKLTALKYKTKISRLKDFTSLHMIVSTLRCDYTCNYCQVSRQNLSADSNQFDMSIETAERALDFIFRSPTRYLKIEFQGGESLLNFSLIKHVVQRAESIAKEQGRFVQYVIATNLSPIHTYVFSELTS